MVRCEVGGGAGGFGHVGVLGGEFLASFVRVFNGVCCRMLEASGRVGIGGFMSWREGYRGGVSNNEGLRCWLLAGRDGWEFLVREQCEIKRAKGII